MSITAVYSAASTADRTNLVFFYGPTFDDHRVYDYDQLNLIRQHSAFNASQTTAFYVHGFLETLSDPDIQAIIAAYNARAEQNLVVYDWGRLSVAGYFLTAVPNAVAVR